MITSCKPCKVFLTSLVAVSLLLYANSAGASTQADPVIDTVTPASAPNNAAAIITIQGSGFQPDLTAHLGSYTLTTRSVQSDGTAAEMTIPWGLPEGAYSLTITNPDGGTNTLPAAFQVNNGIGQFANRGPFGGQIWDVTFKPDNPDIVYATVHEAGLFVSSDSGASWTMLLAEAFPLRLQLSPADSDVLYLNTNRSVLRSTDGGTTWSGIEPTNNGTIAAFPDPVDPQIVYLAEGPNLNNYGQGDPGSLKRSTNFGDPSPSWESLLTNENFSTVVFSPNFATNHTLLAGTHEGKIYKFALTNQDPIQWEMTELVDLSSGIIGDPPARIDRIIYNPDANDEAWVVLRNLFSQMPSPNIYKGSSTIPGSWAEVDISGLAPYSWMKPRGVTLSSNTIFLALSSGFTSPNQQTPSWTAVGQAGIPDESWRDFDFTYFALHPGDQDLIMAGTRAHGVYKSSDGGENWQPVNQGLAGIIPYALAVSPSNLDLVFAATQTDGVLRSADGGQHWEILNFNRGGYPWQQQSMAVDPHNPDVVYIGQWCSQSRGPNEPISDACVKISRDGGATWEDEILPMPTEGEWVYGESYAISPDPRRPGYVFAAATFYPWSAGQDPNNRSGIGGAFYLSDDYGATWQLETVTGKTPAEVGIINRISFASGDATAVYAAGNLGIWLSQDQGITWQSQTIAGCPTNPDPNQTSFSLALHPRSPGEILVSCQDPTSGGFFRSVDSGATWSPITQPDSGTNYLEFHNLPAGPRLYASGRQGVQVSNDGGDTWTWLAGVPMGSSYAFAGGVSNDREVVYVSTTSGMSSLTLNRSLSKQSADSGMMSGGMYGGTFAIHTIYLPVMKK